MSERLAPRADINVTPLIDVLLVLLILFLVVSHASRGQIDTGVARAATGPTPPSPALHIDVRSDGLTLDGHPVTDTIALQAAVASALYVRHDRPVWVKAWPEVSYERLVEVLDSARGAGATRIGILGAADN